jgi:23S rRNA (cytidine1920-2'-O)/16S rRNA (cytidine1409-2'-O)-methyltransferase
MTKTRLDLLLVERGLAESRSKAQALIMAGQVRLAGQVVLKSATAVEPDADVAVDAGPRYVSRGGEKLEAALKAFPIQVAGRVCADLGASTGGFTDCLLQHQAARVYAIDVGKGILHWKIRTDPRVVVLEDTNARHLDSLPEPVSFVSVDASFISLRILLPVLKNWLPLEAAEAADVIALIKPQFEAGRRDVARGDGVIRDPLIHRQVLLDVLSFAQNAGFSVRGLIRSPILGPKGNAEFLVWLSPGGPAADITQWIDSAVPSASG